MKKLKAPVVRNASRHDARASRTSDLLWVMRSRFPAGRFGSSLPAPPPSTPGAERAESKESAAYARNRDFMLSKSEEHTSELKSLMRNSYDVTPSYLPGQLPVRSRAATTG